MRWELSTIYSSISSASNRARFTVDAQKLLDEKIICQYGKQVRSGAFL